MGVFCSLITSNESDEYNYSREWNSITQPRDGGPLSEDEKSRCFGGPEDPLMMAYHDTEWGVPVHDDRVQFEFLCLEGAQAGLSWQTILRKRENYRKAFEGSSLHRRRQSALAGELGNSAKPA